jgi:hypothetical protein
MFPPFFVTHSVVGRSNIMVGGDAPKKRIFAPLGLVIGILRKLLFIAFLYSGI